MSHDPDQPFGELQGLAPHALAERLQALSLDFELAYAKNTRRTWRADWRVWCGYCVPRGLPFLPATVDSLRAFLLDRIEHGRVRATLEHYLATLALAHRLAQLPWPLDTLEGRLMWRALRRTHLSARQRQAQGLTVDALERLLGSLNSSEPRDVRDAALVSLAYETMCRRGELVALKVEDLTREADGSGRLFLPRGKTDQEGAGAVVYVSPETMTLIDRWLALAAHPQGALFRSIPHIRKGAHLESEGRYPRALTDGDIARIFKRRALAAGVEGAANVSGHSTRVGAAQDLLGGNFSVAAVMQQGRWKSERMVARYGERIAAGQSAMAQLLKRRRSNEPNGT